MTGWNIPINTATAAILVLMAAGVIGLVVMWVVQEWAPREDIEDQRPDGWTRARFAASADLRKPVRLQDIVKSVERHLRRHGARPEEVDR